MMTMDSENAVILWTTWMSKNLATWPDGYVTATLWKDRPLRDHSHHYPI